MNNLQPGDVIITHIMATTRDGKATLIRIEHRRDNLTLDPPTPREMYYRVLEPARRWSKSIAGLPDAY